MVVFYVFFQYIFYDLNGDWENTAYTLYYWGVAPIFLIALLYFEFLKPIGVMPKIYIVILAVVIIYHYLRLCFSYDPNYFAFISKLESSKPVYYSSIIYLLLSIPLYLWTKFMKK